MKVLKTLPFWYSPFFSIYWITIELVASYLNSQKSKRQSLKCIVLSRRNDVSIFHGLTRSIDCCIGEILKHPLLGQTSWYCYLVNKMVRRSSKVQNTPYNIGRRSVTSLHRCTVVAWKCTTVLYMSGGDTRICPTLNLLSKRQLRFLQVWRMIMEAQDKTARRIPRLLTSILRLEDGMDADKILIEVCWASVLAFGGTLYDERRKAVKWTLLFNINLEQVNFVDRL